jgi:hypothetical protein
MFHSTVSDLEKNKGKINLEASECSCRLLIEQEREKKYGRGHRRGKVFSQ